MKYLKDYKTYEGLFGLFKKKLSEDDAYDKAGSHWENGVHVVPKLGDNLRTIYIEAMVNLND